jgi:hypothetical protein
MNILETSDKWPRTVRFDSATGFRIPCDESIADVVHPGIVEMKRAGRTPTKLIFGPNAKRALERYVVEFGFTAEFDPRIKQDEFMGLAIEWKAADGIEIK